MNKRVNEIAKERGLPAKEVLAKLKAAGIDVKAGTSSVDEAAALRALGNGGNASRKAPAAATPPAAAPAGSAPAAPARPASAPAAAASSAPPASPPTTSAPGGD